MAAPVPLPADVTITSITNDGATVSWTYPEDDDAIGSIVVQYRSEDENQWQNMTVSPPTNSVRLSGLEPDTDYTVLLVVQSPDGKDRSVSGPIPFKTTRG